MNREERGLYNFENYQNLKYPVNKKPIILVFLILILANFSNIIVQNIDEIKINVENSFNIVNENKSIFTNKVFNNNIDIIQDEYIINNDDTIDDLSTGIDTIQDEDIISDDDTVDDLSTGIDTIQDEDIISNDDTVYDLSTGIDTIQDEYIINIDDTANDLSTGIDTIQDEDIISNDDTANDLSTSIDTIQDEDIIDNNDYNDKVILSQEDIKNILSSLNQYFENMIKSINTGDFSYVESIIVKNSNLYNSQKKLVERLYNLGTTEKLENFEIIEIDDSNILNGLIKVQVLEVISIYYASGESKTSEFNYTYTLENSQNTWLLIDIE